MYQYLLDQFPPLLELCLFSPFPSKLVLKRNQLMRYPIGAVCPCIPPIQARPTLSTIHCSSTVVVPQQQQAGLGKDWKEFHGMNNWKGILHPLHENLRRELLRYGRFVQATYTSLNLNLQSSSFASCLFPKESFFECCGMTDNSYQVTKFLNATSGIQLHSWFENLPVFLSRQSSWIGYVAVCQDKEEISRLGRRDIVVAYRGTVTCKEWLENFRSTLTPLPCATSDGSQQAMVESGFLSLYTSCTESVCSLRDEVKEEISRLIRMYSDEPISLTITGHSLGAALAVLTAYDVVKTLDNVPPVSVISYGGPRVGNSKFKYEVEKCGVKILRIVNSEDPFTKMPGFVTNADGDDMEGDEEKEVDKEIQMAPSGMLRWLQKRVDEQWLYADVGCELRVSSRDSPFLDESPNVVRDHDIETYLHLVSVLGRYRLGECPWQIQACPIQIESNNRMVR